MEGRIVIVGGGAAGIEAAGQLARSGFNVTLIEKEKTTGGHVRNWFHLFPDRRDSSEVISYFNDLLNHENITVITGTTVYGIEKNKKSFLVSTNEGNYLKADAIVL